LWLGLNPIATPREAVQPLVAWLLNRDVRVCAAAAAVAAAALI
jgi:hypothetical protein